MPCIAFTVKFCIYAAARYGVRSPLFTLSLPPFTPSFTLSLSLFLFLYPTPYKIRIKSVPALSDNSLDPTVSVYISLRKKETSKERKIISRAYNGYK